MQPKKIIATAAKLAVSGLLVGYLVVRAANDKQFGDLLAGEKNWPLLILALPICLTAVTMTILRWHLLLRTLALSFSLRESLRAGFLGYLANLLPFGLVAGDSLKAVMLIHRNPRRKTEAIATVVVDRALGLFALFLLAAVASFFLPAEQLARLAEEDRTAITRLCFVVQVVALVGSLVLAVMLVPGVTHLRVWDLLEHTPLIGPVLHKLVGAMRSYRQRIDVLLLSVVVSVLIHVCYVSAIALATRSIGIAPEHQPAIGSIFIIVPPSMIAGRLAYRLLRSRDHASLPRRLAAGAPPNMGLLIALTYRLIQISIAMIGLAYWLAGRSEVRELMHEAEEMPANGEAIAGEESAAAVRA